MLKHWLIDLIGHVSGLSDAQLRQIEKAFPASKALIDLLIRAQPIIEQAQKLYAEAEPLIDEAMKEWQTVGPAAQILIDVIGHHVNKGSSPAEAAEAVRTALNGSIKSVAQDHWIDQQMSCVTVFGGTGFVGRRVVRYLRESGATVRVASRHPRRAEGDDVKQIAADAHDERSVEAAVAGADGVVNAISLYVEHGSDTFHSVHVETAARIASVARRVGAKRLVHLSGIGYGWPRIAAATLDVYARVVARPTRATPAAASGRTRHADARRFALVPSGAEHSRGCGCARRAGAGPRATEAGASGSPTCRAGGRRWPSATAAARRSAAPTAELVVRFRTERQPLSAICLHGDTPASPRSRNDYGAEEAFAAGARARRTGDVLIALSTSGRSANVAARGRGGERARDGDVGAQPARAEPDRRARDDALRVRRAGPGDDAGADLVALHVLCGAVARELALRDPADAASGREGDGCAAARAAPLRRGAAR